jgi:PAS domain S-box-containing protein
MTKFRPSGLHRAAQLAAALLLPAISTAAAATMIPVSTRLSLLFYIPAVAISLAFGGMGAAMLALTFSTVLSWTLFTSLGQTTHPLQDAAFYVLIALSFWLIARKMQTIHRQREQLLALMGTTEASLILCDEHGYVVLWSRGAERLYGWSAEEAEGRLLRHLLHTQPSQGYTSLEKKMQRTGNWSGALKQRCKDGHLLEVQSCSIATDSRKSGLGTMQMIVDFTVCEAEQPSVSPRASASLGSANVPAPPQGGAERNNLALERLLKVIGSVTRKALTGVAPSYMYSECVRVLVQKGGYRLAWVGLLCAGKGYSVSVEAAAGDGMKALTQLTGCWNSLAAVNSSPVEVAAVSGRPVVFHSIGQEADSSSWHTQAAAAGIRALAVFPLMSGREVPAVLVVGTAEAYALQQQEVELLAELAGIVAGAAASPFTETEDSPTRSLLQKAVELPEAKLRVSTSASSATVMVVEDEPNLGQVVCKFLQYGGYDALLAKDYEESMELLHRHEGCIQMLITDLVLPGTSGREIALAACRTNPNLHVLFVSGFDARAVISHGLLDRGASFLQKPFTRAQLLETVAGMLAGKNPSALGAARDAGSPDSGRVSL